MFEQIKLPYAYDALEPHIDALTVETHYAKHHAAYTAAFNTAAEKAGLADKTAEEILSSLDSVEDTALRTALKNNGGGYFNHNFYFGELSPNGGKAPTGAFAEAVNSTFGSFDELKEQLLTAGTTQFGSGWAWLVKAADGSLKIIKTANQDSPVMTGEGTPLLTIDVWEHAYYLKYKNLRAAYIKELFEVIDWDKVSALYEK
ncbi:MAG: superoxide dismutase [Oscillospiraceae bacterium]|nr:superoxide dismutase [Oscillospiraceae bacterium]